MLLFGATLAFAQSSTVTALRDRQHIDDLMIVDCLLPGQVRQLGAAMTYLAPRRPAKTTASDCAIRGGEYVAYDRASMNTALEAWMPSAQAGDKVAQTYVGEIMEKGSGGVPNYAGAAAWYRKAADQGYARALINLGFLYEQGLGVTKDPVAALDLYRKATGIEGTFALEDSGDAPRQDVEALRRELEQTRKELENARRELDRERLKSGAEIESLTRRKALATASDNADETRRLEGMITERERELEARRQQVAKLEQTSDAYKTQLNRLEWETASLRLEIQGARRDLQEGQRDIEAKRDALRAAERTVQATRQEIATLKEDRQTKESARVKALELELQKRDEALNRQRAEMAELEGKLRSNQQTVATLESPRRPAPVGIAAPSIQIIDPSVVVTRGAATHELRPETSNREIVGRVVAPAGLVSLTANDAVQNVDSDGYFRIKAVLQADRTLMRFAAIDRQGKRTVVEFVLAKHKAADRDAATTTAAPAVQPGKYYALVIGNQRYRHLPSLNTPEQDANAVSEILRRRYGFTVKTVLNADRYRMMTELNELRAKLTNRDNLLIYYAGHGELDKANFVANWLPVDADPVNTANWISSSSITEVLNAMQAKHVLVVADSCYSGALSRSSIAQVEPELSDEARIKVLKALNQARSRTVLTSGGVRPVIDGGGGAHSVFASVLLDVLAANQDVLEGTRLFREISARVVNLAGKLRFEQRPQYGSIRFAGGETGDFLFIPVAETRAGADGPGAVATVLRDRR